MAKYGLQTIIERNTNGTILKNAYKSNNINISKQDKDFIANLMYIEEKDLDFFDSITIDSNTKVYKAYMEFIKIGEYIDKNAIITKKINMYRNFRINDIFHNSQNMFNFKIKKQNKLNAKIVKWAQKYFFTIRGNYKTKYFLSIKTLATLSFFTYIIINAIYELRRKEITNTNSNYEIKKYINFKNVNGCESELKLEEFIRFIDDTMYLYEENNKDIREYTSLIYNNNSFIPTKCYNNIYSLFWYILKIHISYLYNQKDSSIYFHCINCTCNGNFSGKRCEKCKKEWDNHRRNVNYQNAAIRNYLKDILNKYNIEEKLANEAKLLINKKNKYDDYKMLNEIKNKIDKYIISQQP